jgi:NAD(P)-dependent dehydrogenase (short-subunit alcohol dehydrogenase family)
MHAPAPRFTDRVVVCVGAAAGMGLSASELFAQEGAVVVMADVDPGVEDAFAELSGRTGCSGFGARCDVRSAQDCDALVARAVAEHGRVDVLAYFAGVVQRPHELADLDEAEWDRVVDVNHKGCFLLMRAAARVMREQGSGRIVAIASDWGRTGVAHFGAYCASKAGVIVLAQSLAHELAEQGITVNTVSPSLIDTEMHRTALREEAEARGVSFEEQRDLEWSQVPMKRAGDPADVARAVMYLASDDAGYVTGASLDVTGGLMRR